MLSGQEGQLTKMSTLLQHLVFMGLTNASEPTQALIAAFLSALVPDGAAWPGQRGAPRCLLAAAALDLPRAFALRRQFHALLSRR